MSRSHRSATVVAVSLALLVSQTAALVHELTATHAICAEHGEVIESGEAAHRTSPLAEGPGWTVAVPESDSAEHGHCAVVAERRELRTLPGVILEVATAADAPAPSIVESSRPATSVALYRLAPKADPPV